MKGMILSLTTGVDQLLELVAEPAEAANTVSSGPLRRVITEIQARNLQILLARGHAGGGFSYRSPTCSSPPPPGICISDRWAQHSLPQRVTDATTDVILCRRYSPVDEGDWAMVQKPRSEMSASRTDIATKTCCELIPSQTRVGYVI